jgi:hypothetical protein
MTKKFRRAKIVACVSAIILLVVLWLNLIVNHEQFESVFLIIGYMSATLLIVYATVMLGIIALELVSKTGD